MFMLSIDLGPMTLLLSPVLVGCCPLYHQGRDNLQLALGVSLLLGVIVRMCPAAMLQHMLVVVVNYFLSFSLSWVLDLRY